MKEDGDRHCTGNGQGGDDTAELHVVGHAHKERKENKKPDNEVHPSSRLRKTPVGAGKPTPKFAEKPYPPHD